MKRNKRANHFRDNKISGVVLAYLTLDAYNKCDFPVSIPHGAYLHPAPEGSPVPPVVLDHHLFLSPLLDGRSEFTRLQVESKY